MGADEAVAMASWWYGAGRTPDILVALAPVFVAVWCCSVGVTWTIELHQLDRGTALGTTVDWISSGVPTSQHQPPEDMVRDLLAARGLHLYLDSTAGPCTHSRHSIGYVCADAEVIALAHRVRDVAARAGTHPLTLAVHWVASGLSPDAGSVRGLRQRAQRSGMMTSSRVAD